MFWRRKSKMRKPRISYETIALLKKMSKENGSEDRDIEPLYMKPNRM
jgi:hypothetical protein